MMFARSVTLSAAVVLGLSLAAPAAEAAARKAGAGIQQAPKASRISTIGDGATSDLRDLVNKVEQNRQSKKNTR